MLVSKFLNQNEIDALLNQDYDSEELLSPEELDALGEIANISMGSGATALSELVNQKVTITNPQVLQISLDDFLNQLPRPHLAIKVEFISGLMGSNLLVISNTDAAILAKIMMGEDPTSENDYLDEIQISAASEAMNQMIASAATAMAQIFQRTVNISPPDVKPFDHSSLKELTVETKLVVTKFEMTIGNILKTQFFQMISLETAREQAQLLFKTNNMVSPDITSNDQPSTQEDQIITSNGQSNTENDQIANPFVTEQPILQQPDIPSQREIPSSAPAFHSEGNMDLILDIPLTVSVVLGKTKKPIQEVLMYQSGSILELNRLIDENVDIMVNNVLVAKGEVVVINDNFGVRITNIMNPGDRISQLKNGTLT